MTASLLMLNVFQLAPSNFPLRSMIKIFTVTYKSCFAVIFRFCIFFNRNYKFFVVVVFASQNFFLLSLAHGEFFSCRSKLGSSK